MVDGLLDRVARVRVTLGYALIVSAVTIALASMGPSAQDRIVRHSSTNLHNLSHGRIGTLLGSAFVVDAGPLYMWLPGLMCLMALAELHWGSGRLVIAFVVGHIGATVLVAFGLAAAISKGWLPGSLARVTDVGMSYGAAAVLGSLTAAIAVRWRPVWIGWWLAIGTVAVVTGRDFTDVGHVVALALGMVVSLRFGRPREWTTASLLLLAAGACFGYLVLAATPAALVIGPGLGVLTAAVFAIAWPTAAADRSARGFRQAL